MQAIEPLEYGNMYHIYNRGINGTDLFAGEVDYERFLALYRRYITPVADTYAWVLLGNHFHLLVRIREENEIAAPTLTLTAVDRPCQRWQGASPSSSPLTGSIDHCQGASVPPCQWSIDPDSGSGRNSDRSSPWKPAPSKQFSHLFNAYAQYFNKLNKRHGGLFETPFQRIRVTGEKYFRRLIYYIHHNPVKHGFAEHILDWGWSSYLTMLSVRPTRLSRDTVLGRFDSQSNFRAYHEKDHDPVDIQDFLLEW